MKLARSNLPCPTLTSRIFFLSKSITRLTDRGVCFIHYPHSPKIPNLKKKHNKTVAIESESWNGLPHFPAQTYLNVNILFGCFKWLLDVREHSRQTKLVRVLSVVIVCSGPKPIQLILRLHLASQTNWIVCKLQTASVRTSANISETDEKPQSKHLFLL